MPTETSTPPLKTRSNTKNITYQEIKALLDNLKTDLKSEINKVNDKIEALFKRLDVTDDKVRALEDRCHTLEEGLKNKGELDSGLDPEAVLREAEERFKRRRYIVLSGIPEHLTGSVDERSRKDNQIVGEIMKELGVAHMPVEDIARIGPIRFARPRILRCKCKKVDDKLSILKAARKLRNSDRFKNIYINADQTFQQRVVHKSLRTELQNRREAGEDVAIHYGKVIKKSDVPKTQFFH